jgi:hypothetical protein
MQAPAVSPKTLPKVSPVRLRSWSIFSASPKGLKKSVCVMSGFPQEPAQSLQGWRTKSYSGNLSWLQHHPNILNITRRYGDSESNLC